jgi:hypothetical protein
MTNYSDIKKLLQNAKDKISNKQPVGEIKFTIPTSDLKVTEKMIDVLLGILFEQDENILKDVDHKKINEKNTNI